MGQGTVSLHALCRALSVAILCTVSSSLKINIQRDDDDDDKELKDSRQSITDSLLSDVPDLKAEGGWIDGFFDFFFADK